MLLERTKTTVGATTLHSSLGVPTKMVNADVSLTSGPANPADGCA